MTGHGSGGKPKAGFPLSRHPGAQPGGCPDPDDPQSVDCADGVRIGGPRGRFLSSQRPRRESSSAGSKRFSPGVRAHWAFRRAAHTLPTRLTEQGRDNPSISEGCRGSVCSGSTLCAITATRSHAAFAPKYLQGIPPPASPFFTTSCTPSMVPAFSRRHCSSRGAFHSPMLLRIARCLIFSPSSNHSPCFRRIRIATYRNGCVSLCSDFSPGTNDTSAHSRISCGCGSPQAPQASSGTLTIAACSGHRLRRGGEGCLGHLERCPLRPRIAVSKFIRQHQVHLCRYRQHRLVASFPFLLPPSFLLATFEDGGILAAVGFCEQRHRRPVDQPLGRMNAQVRPALAHGISAAFGNRSGAAAGNVNGAGRRAAAGASLPVAGAAQQREPTGTEQTAAAGLRRAHFCGELCDPERRGEDRGGPAEAGARGNRLPSGRDRGSAGIGDGEPRAGAALGTAVPGAKDRHG
jgi:hypothetical protein